MRISWTLLLSINIMILIKQAREIFLTRTFDIGPLFVYLYLESLGLFLVPTETL